MRTEVVAGITTFMTMAYIIIVNPGIVADAGMPMQAVMIATCISAALASLLMGFLANYPFALAPGMGLNAYFTYTVVLGMGVPWETALGAVFISGVIFFVLSVTSIREAVVNSVPASLKAAIGAGIGLFIAFIGLQNGKIVVDDGATLVALGDLTHPETLLALIGLLITAVLMARRVKGAILIGIVVSAIIGIPMGLIQMPSAIVGLPSFSMWAPIFGKLDIGSALNMGFLTIVFAFLFVDFFDTVGTLIGVSSQAGLLDEKGRLPKAGRAFMADSIGTMSGAVFGTPTVTAYVESAAGVAMGGRTGLTAVVVALGFLLSLLFTPLITALAGVSAITAPALIIVGSLMVKAVLGVDWDDASEGIPAFIAMIAMPLTYSIATGIALGFIAYPIVKVLSGKGKDVHWIMYLLGALFIARFAFLG